MKWPAPFIFAYVLLALEPVVREALRLGPTSAAPSLVFPLVVFVALYAPITPALWTALLTGLAVDLTTLRGGPNGAFAIVGPHALGFAAGAYLILLARPMFMRRSVMAFVLLAILGAALAGIVAISILTIRTVFTGSWADGSGLLPGSELLSRMLSALYTGASALVIGPLLNLVISTFGFQDPGLRRSMMSSRRY